MFRRYSFISLALLAFMAGVVLSLQALGTKARYSVIVLTVESTRLNAFSDSITPNLWRAARQGTRFSGHRASSAWTGANIVSILTGQSAFRHGIHSRSASLPANWDLPLKHLSAAGWKVEGTQPFMLIEGFRNLGLDVAPATVPTSWLATQAMGKQPFFLWYHYLETHLPYEAADGVARPANAAAASRMDTVRTKPAIPADAAAFQPEDRRWIEPLYLAQFNAFDDWFQDFWRFFNNSGLRDTTILILTTDHGEELLERGAVGHASTTRSGHLHEEITRVPLIVWLPPSLQTTIPAKVIDAPSSHLDIMPTILNRLLPDDPIPLDGKDLFALPENRTWQGVTSRAGFAEPDPGHIKHFIAARVEDKWKLHVEFQPPAQIDNVALYDLSADPGETSDLSAREPARAARMLRALMPDIIGLRIASPNRTRQGDDMPTVVPDWVFPQTSTTVTFDELPSPLKLRWRGEEAAEYRLQYRAGEGAFSLDGEIAVNGQEYDFGPLSREYWNRYIVPYGVFHFRLGLAGAEETWGPWLTIRVTKE